LSLVLFTSPAEKRWRWACSKNSKLLHPCRKPELTIRCSHLKALPLLAVAALRENKPFRARELHRHFPDNELSLRETDRIDKGAH
jgi:hypothetical protein